VSKTLFYHMVQKISAKKLFGYSIVRSILTSLFRQKSCFTSDSTIFESSFHRTKAICTILVAKLFGNEIDFNSPFDAAAAGDDNLVAHAVRGKAIAANPVSKARRLPVQAVGIGRGSKIAYSVDAGIYVRNNFIHADHYDYIFWTVN